MVCKFVWKSTVSTEFLVNRPKLCGNSAFPQNFHTSKLGEITVFYSEYAASGIQMYHRPNENNSLLSIMKYTAWNFEMDLFKVLTKRFWNFTQTIFLKEWFGKNLRNRKMNSAYSIYSNMIFLFSKMFSTEAATGGVL